jgi:hypothetical protein
MSENRLPPAEEARVRTAAEVAGQRMGWTVPGQVLDYIVATSDPRQSPSALEVRAAAIVDHVKNDTTAPNFRDTPDREAQTYFQTIHGQLVSRLGALPWNLASTREDASTASDSAGNALGAMANSSLRYVERAAYDIAIKTQGLEWAAHNRDLLRLGPEAMKILAATQFKEASYNRMKEVGFKDNQIVDTAKYAKRYGLDANKAAEISADSVRVFGGDDERERKRWRDMIHDHQHDPEHAGKRQKLRDALQERGKHHDPAHRDQARRHLEQLDEVDKARAKADRKADKAATRETAAATHEAVAATRENRAAIAQVQQTEAAQRANDLFAAAPAPSPAAGQASPPASTPASTPVPNQAPAQSPANAPASAPNTPQPAPVKATTRPAANTLG